jgi:hypothetical protein
LGAIICLSRLRSPAQEPKQATARRRLTGRWRYFGCRICIFGLYNRGVYVSRSFGHRWLRRPIARPEKTSEKACGLCLWRDTRVVHNVSIAAQCSLDVAVGHVGFG